MSINVLGTALLTLLRWIDTWNWDLDEYHYIPSLNLQALMVRPADVVAVNIFRKGRCQSLPFCFLLAVDPADGIRLTRDAS